MKIAFVDPIGWAYDTRTPLNEPLGGTQSAVAYLTAELARLGIDVTVANGVTAPIFSDGVHFVSLNDLSGEFLNRFDVVVVVASACGNGLRRNLAVNVPIVLWCHQISNGLGVTGLAQPDERKAWNGYAMVSNWQAED